jgi:hypothetical protein
VVPEQTDEWYAAQLVPMLYDWEVIENVGTPIPLEAEHLEDARR